MVACNIPLRFGGPARKHRDGGFTMLEIMLTAAIIIVITTIGLLAWFGYEQGAALDQATREILNMLNEAQGRATGQVDNSRWGVRITNPSGTDNGPYAELFAGDSYYEGTIHRRAQFSDFVEFSDPADGSVAEIVFEQRSGKPLAIGSELWATYGDADNDTLKAAHYRPPLTVLADDFTGTDNDPWDSTKWTVTSTGAGAADPDIQSNEGHMHFQSAAGASDQAIGQMPNVENAEVLLKYRFGATGIRGLFRVFLRADGTFTLGMGGHWPQTGYGIEMVNGNDTVSVYRIEGGAITATLGTFSKTADTNANWLRFRVVGNEIKARIWDDGASEPAAWDGEYTDSNITGGGVLQMVWERSGGTFDLYIDDLTVQSGLGTGCENNAELGWTCETLAGAPAGVGDIQRHDIAAGPDGSVWASFVRRPDTMTNRSLYAAKFVGFGGNCDTLLPTGSDRWDCTLVHLEVDATYNGIAVDANGMPQIFYAHEADDDSWMATYTGSGTETSCSGGSADWDCQLLTTTNTLRWHSIAINSSGTAWAAADSSDLFVTRYVGGGGGSCPSNSDWDCWTVTTSVDAGGTIENARVSISGTGRGWISYEIAGAAEDLGFARYTGTGTETSCGAGGSADWMCGTIDTSKTSVGYTDLVFNQGGIPWIAYYADSNLYTAKKVTATGPASGGTSNPIIAYKDETNGDLRVATYSGTGTETSCGGGSADWDCVLVASSAMSGSEFADIGTDIAFTTSGDAWIVTHENGGDDLWLMQYVGSGGDCDTQAAGSDAWNCTIIATDDGAANRVGEFAQIVIDSADKAWITYSSESAGFEDTWVAEYVGSGGNCDDTWGGDAEADAWNCTLVVDHAGASEQMRKYVSLALDADEDPWFVVAEGDEIAGCGTAAGDCSLWVVEYVGSGGNCDDNNGGSDAWNCTLLAEHSGGVASEEIGMARTGLAFDQSGTPWVSFTDDLDDDTIVATRVGSGGNCDDNYGGSDAWDCTVIADNQYGGSGRVSGDTRIAISSSDAVWVSFPGASDNDAYLAQYVGSGGNCDTDNNGSDAWNCTRIQAYSGGMQLQEFNDYNTVALDASGNPWIAMYEHRDTVCGDFGGNCDVWIAEYVGSGGNCDDTYGGQSTVPSADAWNCTVVEATGWLGRYISMAFPPASGGSPAGTCDNADWTCELIEATNDVGNNADIAIGSTGNPVIIHQDRTGTNELRIARYTGSGTETTCGGGSSNWSCAWLDAPSGVSVGDDTSLSASILQSFRLYSVSDDANRVVISVSALGGISVIDG